MTLRKTLRRAALRAVVATVAVIACWATFGRTETATVGQQPDQKAAKVAAAIHRYGCWTGEAPHHQIPGHALISYGDGDPTYVDARLGFSIWLHPHAPRNRGYHLHAFCP